MLGKILLVILLIPIAYVALLVVAGLLAGVVGVTVYYSIKYLLIGIVALAIFWLVKEFLKEKE